MLKIDERMKQYEKTYNYKLLPKEPVVIRIDGKAFHSFTRGCEKPFDMKLIEAMVSAGEKTAKEMMGFKLGYCQSDEFTFLLSDLDNFESEAWFGNEIQKIASVSASLFTAFFNKEMGGTIACFDSRAFNIPLADAPNIFVWRQQDWERNSLQMLSRSHFSHKQLIGKGRAEMNEMLFSIGDNWAELPDVLKNGTFITKTERINKKLNYAEINNYINNKEKTNIYGRC